MQEDTLRKKRCCFSGHRPEKLTMDCWQGEETEAEIKKRVHKAVQDAIADGFETFITGMARGLDLWAADVILEAKEQHPHIKLICAVPFEGFEKRWGASEQAHYQGILAAADFVKVVSPGYSRACFQIRNEYMVDRSNRVIVAYNGTPGGTRNTIYYARRRGVAVVNILDEAFPI